ncbi:hypothetical protein MLD38_031426 [Melastoma candidum]|uniref:Uncharacterized protein n=1 Tax=Melastoma candidum TaxID=119954 RepID=A0ACB9MPN9_9MYRT|nr:hypothetical protein MLD38_031426 [Melastoma candidum]
MISAFPPFSFDADLNRQVEQTIHAVIRVFYFRNNAVCCTGIDRQRVHQSAASVCSCNPFRGFQRERDNVHRRGHQEEAREYVTVS